MSAIFDKKFDCNIGPDKAIIYLTINMPISEQYDDRLISFVYKIRLLRHVSGCALYGGGR